ncbi:uncharacterized protein SCHCODRAFT_02553826 [Schizophyllum commune H4-8]|uniref:uncharacterized protein n=1 Tax=Schizophyllum commune (strain H4-8 / FGSC 9210) TaxID=578458 RepID=UPI00215FD868|nr:uncharacterized protein SCHCODRAFT_02553826 [Schizophyllum commune H4-8]KAI5886793.1 hypothetical protein SCHCODRAFT_02553826 [Schizophyllum commune H4-8]
MSVEDTFAKLCRNEDTIQSAHAFYRRAKARTGPGSGFDLGTSVAALPAICAYKASQSLNNDDVSRVAAQAVSCIAPKDFDIALHKVEAALCDTRRSMTVWSYPELVRKHSDKIRSSSALLSLLGKTEEALDATGKAKKVKENEKMASILFWVCRQKTGEDMFKRSGFCRMHGVAPDMLGKIVELLDKRAAPLAKEAEKILNAQPAPTRPTSPTKSPIKRELPHGGSPHKKAAPVRELPHGGSPHKKAAPVRELPHGGSPHKPQASSHKPQASPRKAPPPIPALFPNLPQPSSAAESGSDDEVDFLSPKKRRKVAPADKQIARDESPSPARSRAARSSPVKAAAEPMDAHVSPRRSTRVQEMEDTVVIQTSPRKTRKAVEVPMDVDSDTSEDEKQPQVRRRFRPVFLDTVQWNTRDPLAVKLEQSKNTKQKGRSAA